MNIGLAIIFSIANIIVYLSIKYSLKGILTHKNGMILGMHVGQEYIEDQELVGLVDKYKKKFKIFNLFILIGVVATPITMWIDMMLSIRVFLVWIIIIVIYMQIFSTRAMRDMYSLKEDKGWVNNNSKTLIKVDTRVTAAGDRMYIKPSVHIVFIVFFGFMILDALMKGPIYDLVLKRMTQSTNITGINDMRMTLLLILSLGSFISISYFMTHRWYTNKANRVYCDNSDINYRANMVDKWYWSLAMVIGGTLNLIAHVYMIVAIGINGWIDDSSIFAYICILILSSIVTIFIVSLVDTKISDVLRLAKNIEYVDDDYYWRRGYYYNPDSNKLFVQDRFSSTNLNFNMAKRSAKVINGLLSILFIGTMVFTFYVTFGSSDIDLVMRGDNIRIKASTYETSFDISDIEEVSLVDDIKDTSVIRTNGMSIDDIDIGHYVGKKEGKMMLYINSDKRPLLKIKLKDKFVYVSGDDNLDVKMVYKKIVSAR